MTHESTRLRELGQLLRLRRLREDAARAERDERRRACEAAQAAVREREALIEQARARRDALGAYITGDGAATISRLAPFAGARREALDEALERAEYALIDDEAALARAERAFADAQAAWLRAAARSRAVEQLNERTRRGFMRAAEQYAERELDTARPIGMQTTHEGAR
ncbi:hypothetical protein [Piscinibacter sp.]|uniref:hypothetical protein n=1 Tax=Piscinibacter sp. TaxID=1903157 RepID=UPI002CF6AE4F|nr:hypothetical protein [Albitalea sp.]HUG22605.1 hypothetical protein [Albitalea sp.]